MLACLRERAGEKFEYTYQANPGEVWEEDEFWINLSWAIDPDGSMGIRQYFESPYRPGQKFTVDEYYGWIFENSVPGLPETARKEGLTPLQYMRKYGAFEITRDVYKQNEKPVSATDLAGSRVESNGVVTKDGKPVGVMVDDKPVVGYNTPSRKLELFSKTMADWKWPEFALPEYYRSHIHRSAQAVSRENLCRRFRSALHAGSRLAKRRAGRCLHAAADLPFAQSDPHALGQCQISLRNLAQESAMGESGGRRKSSAAFAPATL